jgi:ribosome-associated protein
LDFNEKARSIVNLAQDKNAEQPVALHVTEVCGYTDVIVICHGRSTRQVQTIVGHVTSQMKKLGEYAAAVEGEKEGLWVLVDYGDVVFHVFFEPMRPYYDLEGIYPDAPKIDIPPPAAQV